MTFLSLNALRKTYGPVAALDGVHLAIRRGSRTAIVGPSGSGKTTLLRLIAGFDVPDSGSILLDGRLLADGTAAEPAYRRGIGVVMQDGALFPHLTIADNIGFGLPRGESRRQRIVELLDTVGLDRSMLDRKPDQLSGGQQQRVAIARALAIRPRLMLLDEPFSALDTGLRAATRQAVAAMLESAGVTTILVTHDQAEALSFADQVAIMRDGKLVQAGTPEELYRRPVNAATAEFLGQAIILPAKISGGRARCSLGEIRVEGPDFEGEDAILLRPEQIQLTPVTADGGAGVARIETIAFFGGWSDLTIRPFADAGGIGAAISLRQGGAEAFRPGMAVSAVLSGVAHRFQA